MADAFYPFVEGGGESDGLSGAVRHAARIAVYDDEAAAPRVLLVEPSDVRNYLEEITATVARLSKEQGGSIPFMVIREIVENLVHAYFTEPTISILDGGDTIRFADQGPGIADKELALEYGTTSATDDMKRYIRGVGSGLPYAQQWLSDKGGTLHIEDNISRGTVVTISLLPERGHTQGATTPGGYDADRGGQQAAVTSMPAFPQAMPSVQLPPQGAIYAPYGLGYVAAAPYPPQVVPQVPMGHPYASAMQTPYQASPTRQPSERGMLALGYLATHESVGPTELVHAFGHSQSTWTRELKALEDAGLVAKRGGQKRFLTPSGQALLAR